MPRWHAFKNIPLQFMKALNLTNVKQQIFIGTFLVLAVGYFVMGFVVYRSLSGLIQSYTDKVMQNIVMQADDSITRFLNQADIVTFQIAVDPRLQSLLYELKTSGTADITVDQKMTARLILGELRFYAASITAIELYSGNRVVYPVSRKALDQRVDTAWIRAADQRPGELIWIGPDPLSPSNLLAIRQVRLENDRYEGGGYLVVSISKDLIPFFSPEFPQIEGSFMYLFDQKGQAVASTDMDHPAISSILYRSNGILKLDNESYVVNRRVSKLTGWTLVVVTPLRTFNEGLLAMQRAMLWAGLVGAGLLLVMVHSLSTMITRPIRKLIRSMRGTSDGIPQKNPDRYWNSEMNALNDTYNNMIKQINDLVSTVYEKELTQGRAELKALQAQINPHFLYNTLEAFYWLLKEKDEDDLAAKVVALSNMFRYTVTGPDAGEWVTVADEVKHAEQYMSLMLLRFSDRIGWRADIAPETLPVRMPKLMIQPLIENAIYHGIEPRKGRGTISLSVRPTAAGEDIAIRVEDDGSGMDPQYLHKAATAEHAKTISGRDAGIGLTNIHRRLRLYYGNDRGITIRSEEGVGTVIEFYIPRGGRTD